jgi:hypothetical protein
MEIIVMIDPTSIPTHKAARGQVSAPNHWASGTETRHHRIDIMMKEK